MKLDVLYLTYKLHVAYFGNTVSALGTYNALISLYIWAAHIFFQIVSKKGSYNSQTFLNNIFLIL